MSDPHGPREESAAGPERQPTPPQAGAQPPTESEPAPSAAPPPDSETAASAMESPQPPPYGMPPSGHYVFVPDGQRNRRFGPAFGRFARNRATHLVAAVVVGALIGGGTVAIVDNAGPGDRGFQVRPGGPFDDHRFPDFRFGDGQRFGN